MSWSKKLIKMSNEDKNDLTISKIDQKHTKLKKNIKKSKIDGHAKECQWFKKCQKCQKRLKLIEINTWGGIVVRHAVIVGKKF